MSSKSLKELCTEIGENKKVIEKLKFQYFKNRARLAKIFKLEHRVAFFSKLFTFYGNGNKFNLQDLLGESHKKLIGIVVTILLLVEKKKIKTIFWTNVSQSKKWLADV